MLRSHFHRPLGTALGSALLALTPMASAQVEDLGIDDVDHFFLSRTGEAGAGQRRRADGFGEAFRWRSTGAVDSLLTPTGVRGSAFAVSDDGSVVCGRAIGPGAAKQAIRWDDAGVPLDVSLATSPVNVPVGMSRDGETIALETRTSIGNELAAIWTSATGTVAIPPPPGFLQSEIIRMSEDGSAAVGRYYIDSPTIESADYFLWSSSTGLAPFVGPGGADVWPDDISADGSVVTGTTEVNGQDVIFRWTAAGGFETAPVPFIQMEYVRVSADGSVLYGINLYALIGRTNFFTWTSSGGFVNYTFDEELVPSGVTADGSALVGTFGTYFNPESRATRLNLATGFGGLDSFGGASTASSITLDGALIGGTRVTSEGGRAVIWRAGGSIGEAYCGPGVPNSTGFPSEMSLTGSNISEFGSMTLQASGLPPSSFGFFLAAQSDGFASMPGGSQGNLCLGGAIGRFVDPGQIGNSGSTGTLSLEIDPRSLPGPNGPILPSFGGQWYFQAWHRDANPTTTSNFSDAVAIYIY